MMRHDIQHHQAILDPATSGNLVTEDDFFAVVVHPGSENEFTGVVTRIPSHQSSRGCAPAARLKDSPAGKATRDFLHVLLRVSAIDAARVQFHQLTRVILIDAAGSLLLLRSLLLRIVTHQHGEWTTCRPRP